MPIEKFQQYEHIFSAIWYGKILIHMNSLLDSVFCVSLVYIQFQKYKTKESSHTEKNGNNNTKNGIAALKQSVIRNTGASVVVILLLYRIFFPLMLVLVLYVPIQHI